MAVVVIVGHNTILTFHLSSQFYLKGLKRLICGKVENSGFLESSENITLYSF